MDTCSKCLKAAAESRSQLTELLFTPDRLLEEYIDKNNLSAEEEMYLRESLDKVLFHNTLLLKTVNNMTSEEIQLAIKQDFKQRFQEIKKCLNETLFSVIMQTRVNDKEYVSYISVRYIEPSGNVIQHYLHMIELKDRNNASLRTFKAFKKYFEDNYIKMQNIVSLMYHNDSIEVEKSKRFPELLKQVVPNLIILDPVLQFSKLIDLKKDYGTISEPVDNLILSISDYFLENTNSYDEYQNYLQSLPEYKSLNIKPSNSVRQEFQRYDKIINEWSALENYFDIKIKKLSKSNIKYKISSEQNIYNLLQDKYTKAYAYFLQYCLSFHSSLNLLYETENLLIYDLYESIIDILFDLGSDLVEKPLEPSLRPSDKDFYLNPLVEIDIGFDYLELLKDMPAEDIEKFHHNCINFYKITFNKIKDKLAYYYDKFGRLSFLDTMVVIMDEEEIPSITNSIELQKSLLSFTNSKSLIKEWKALPIFNENDKDAYLNHSDDEHFWEFVYQSVNGENIRKLLQAIFSLPHSMVQLESIIEDVISEVKVVEKYFKDKKLINTRVFMQSVSKAYILQRRNYKFCQKNN